MWRCDSRAERGLIRPGDSLLHVASPRHRRQGVARRLHAGGGARGARGVEVVHEAHLAQEERLGVGEPAALGEVEGHGGDLGGVGRVVVAGAGIGENGFGKRRELVRRDADDAGGIVEFRRHGW